MLLFITGVFHLRNAVYEAGSIHVEWSNTGRSSYCGRNESLHYLFIISIHRQVVLRRITHNCPTLGRRQVRCREIFTGLNESTNYTVTIIAVNRAGNGSSETINVMMTSSGNISYSCSTPMRFVYI